MSNVSFKPDDTALDRNGILFQDGYKATEQGRLGNLGEVGGTMKLLLFMILSVFAFGQTRWTGDRICIDNEKTINCYENAKEEEVINSIRVISNRLGISKYVNILIAIARVESNFKNISGKDSLNLYKNALGIFQIKFSTAKLYCPYIKTPFHLFNYDKNILCGVMIFRNSMKKYKDLRLTIASHNTGSPVFDKSGKISNQEYVDEVLKKAWVNSGNSL